MKQIHVQCATPCKIAFPTNKTLEMRATVLQ